MTFSLGTLSAHRSSPAKAARRTLALSALALLLAALDPPSASAQCAPQEVIKLLASDGAANDYLGHGVALSGDTAVVGGYGNDDNGGASGSAYVFERNQGGADQWGEVKKLVASDGQAGDIFGFTVAISGDIVVVGASLDDDMGADAGSLYVFERDQGGPGNWGEVEKITASDGAAGDRFGLSLSLSGETLIAGAHRDDDLGTDSGSVYLFARDQGGAGNWGLVKKIQASDGAANDFFGKAARISGDTALVGANGDDDLGANSGSAYVFERDQGGPDNWGEVKKLIASDGAAGDVFGETLAISNDTLFVTAVADDDFGVDSGAAYVFERDAGGAGNWGEVKKLTASDAAAGDRFGDSVTMSGDVVVFGALFDDDNGADSGSGYVFHRDQGGAGNWGEIAKLSASDGAAGDLFGSFVSVSGDTALFGAFQQDDNGSDSGVAYVVDVSVAPPPDTYCTAQVNSAGCLPFVSSTGVPSASAGSGFLISANEVLANKTGLLFYSVHGPRGGPFQGGFLCATPPTRRTAMRTASVDGPGVSCPSATVGTATFDFNARIANGLDPALVHGQEVWSQFWLRDGLSPSGTNLTDGLHFTICY